MINHLSIHPDDYIRGELFEGINRLVPNAIYCKTDFIPQFLSNQAHQIPIPFILVSHNSDYPVSDRLLAMAKQVRNLRKWFGQNVECQEHPLVQSIPIGLENDRNFPHLMKRKNLRVAAEKAASISPPKLLYMNYSFHTNRSERVLARECVIRNLTETSFTDRCVDAVSNDRFNSWVEEAIQHRYVLCPRGNGIDTHRMWETLYMGRIPIVKSDSNNIFYRELPILYVKEWSDVTEELMLSQIERLTNLANFNMSMLSFSWWKDNIGKLENLR